MSKVWHAQPNTTLFHFAKDQEKGSENIPELLKFHHRKKKKTLGSTPLNLPRK